MPGFAISYAGYTLTNQGGHRWFRRQARYESDLPQTPAFRALVTYLVKHTFLEASFADNQARYAQRHGLHSRRSRHPLTGRAAAGAN